MKSLSGNASQLLHCFTNFCVMYTPRAVLHNAIRYGQYFQKYQIHLPSTVLPLILYPLIMKLTCSSHLEPHLHPPGPFCLPSDCRFLKSLRQSEVRYLVYRRSNLPVTSMLRSTICIPATWREFPSSDLCGQLSLDVERKSFLAWLMPRFRNFFAQLKSPSKYPAHFLMLRMKPS